MSHQARVFRPPPRPPALAGSALLLFHRPEWAQGQAGRGRRRRAGRALQSERRKAGPAALAKMRRRVRKGR